MRIRGENSGSSETRKTRGRRRGRGKTRGDAGRKDKGRTKERRLALMHHRGTRWRWEGGRGEKERESERRRGGERRGSSYLSYFRAPWRREDTESFPTRVDFIFSLPCLVPFPPSQWTRHVLLPPEALGSPDAIFTEKCRGNVKTFFFSEKLWLIQVYILIILCENLAILFACIFAY